MFDFDPPDFVLVLDLDPDFGDLELVLDLMGVQESDDVVQVPLLLRVVLVSAEVTLLFLLLLLLYVPRCEMDLNFTGEEVGVELLELWDEKEDELALFILMSKSRLLFVLLDDDDNFDLLDDFNLLDDVDVDADDDLNTVRFVSSVKHRVESK